jgi:hypothetical protein
MKKSASSFRTGGLAACRLPRSVAACWLPAGLVISSVLLVGFDGPGDRKGLLIRVQADGEHCLVAETPVMCADVVRYLRDDLKVSPGTRLTVHGDTVPPTQQAPYQAVGRLIMELNAAKVGDMGEKIRIIDATDAEATEPVAPRERP